MINKFNAWLKEHPPTYQWTTGWHVVTPERAEDLLKRNRLNRKVALGTVQRYARDMQAGAWIKTGQPGLIDTNGEVFDIQHRAWAGYLSGNDFETFIVTDVPANPDLFAYIDGGKPRSAADALYTAGENGLSGAIAQAVAIAHRYDNKALGVIKQAKIPTLTNPEVLSYSRQHPGLNKAAHLMFGSYGKAISVIKHKGVALFAGWQILERYGALELDQFMIPLGSGANLDEDDPILALRNRLISLEDDDLNKERRLALLIKAFSMHQLGKTVPRSGLALRDNERFPRFEDILPMPLAAQ